MEPASTPSTNGTSIMDDLPAINGTSETLISLYADTSPVTKQRVLHEQNTQSGSLVTSKSIQNSDERGGSGSSAFANPWGILHTDQDPRQRRQILCSDYIKTRAAIKAKETFDYAFPDHLKNNRAISVGKFGLNRLFNYLIPVIKTTIQDVQPPAEPIYSANLRPLILVIVLGPKSSVDHSCKLAQEACSETWIKPGVISQYYTQGDCDATLLVATPAAFIWTTQFQRIYLSEVRHLIIDDGNVMVCPKDDSKAIYDINRHFHDLPVDCHRSLFTIFSSDSSKTFTNVLTRDFALVSVADHATCFELTISSLWNNKNMNSQEELSEEPRREATLICVPSHEFATELVQYLRSNNFNAYTPLQEHNFEGDPNFEELSEEDRRLALIEYNHERDSELFGMVKEFNNSESDFLVLTRDAAHHLIQVSLGAYEVRPTPAAARKEYSFRKPPKVSFWKKLLHKKPTKKKPVSPQNDAQAELLKQEQVPYWLRAKLKSNKIVINYDSHDTSYDIFTAYGVRFDEPSDYSYDEFLRRLYTAELQRRHIIEPTSVKEQFSKRWDSCM